MSSKSCLDRVKQTEDEGKTSHLKKFNLTDKTYKSYFKYCKDLFDFVHQACSAQYAAL